MPWSFKHTTLEIDRDIYLRANVPDISSHDLSLCHFFWFNQVIIQYMRFASAYINMSKPDAVSYKKRKTEKKKPKQSLHSRGRAGLQESCNQLEREHTDMSALCDSQTR